ncbi:uncharacterized protein LOC121590098 isoform X1 [Anopheles merus]|uniref:Uncharacterized protein n=1 Tax=Anopheles merus TaxID=30066 RepID=A0A182UN94_ANOME|nr:uncharacterized protein LOC121590098 isoform X1 [Anopheles merus]XP_041765423.1 uncharacterized protein LOC121590098 isoform X1 [Anopheles merus]XP_041765424.1 uncharacterized protein LOC121590098 isoform X1 [Anopheles merus]XP_041765425.1 uncharacterized protein LOC121590098 isoform X1 [Anopheles merus]XP_041765426.1 uncharacterized protein LOC121590098 isoform X1 [Anopheles merus]
MKQSVQSELSVAPGNIGSYGMFGSNGGNTNTTNRKRPLPASSTSLCLLALTTLALLCTCVTATTEATIVNATSVTESAASNVTSSGRASGRPLFSTGNQLWDALIADCMRKPTFACIQKNVYSFLGEQLDVENVNFTNRVQFLRNRVDFTKYTREANEAGDEEEDNENEIPNARSAFEPASPIEEVTTALREKSLKFMLTHDVSIQMPEVMFDGAIFRIEPRAIEGNGMIAKLEFVPRTELAEARGHGTPRILFKKIKKFFQNKLLLAFLAIVLIIKIIKIKVMWLLPLMVGVGTAKKLVLKFLLFLFPALSHIFKLCSYYHASYHKPNFHHHQHHINHLHTFYPHNHDHAVPELIYTKPPRGHPSEFLHGAPVPPHTHYQPEVNYEFTAPGLGSEFISDRNSYVDTSFKPKYDDLNDIKAWGLGESTNTSAPQSSPYFTSPPASSNGAVGGSGSYNVNPLTQHAASRVNSPKPVYGPPGYTSSAQKRIPTGAATSIAAQYVSAPSGPTLSAEEQIIREAQRQEAYRIAQEQKLIAKQQAIVNQQAYVQEGVTPRPVDPFYSPILQRLDKVFNSLGIVDESCRERLVCSMYKNPVKYSPHSNYVSAELSRDASELQKPTSTNAAVVRFYRYVQAARDGQDQRDCQRIYSQCTINMEKKKKK